MTLGHVLLVTAGLIVGYGLGRHDWYRARILRLFTTAPISTKPPTNIEVPVREWTDG